MRFTLFIWRQSNKEEKGRFKKYQVDDISSSMSFLEMLDLLNEQLINKNEDPVTFDHDCREGICGSCSLVINGVAHGPERGTTACQLHMRSFKDGETIHIEPWRAKSFPINKDLSTNRRSFDSIIQSGGFISINSGSVPDANSTPIPKTIADKAMDAAACIGCGACAAACKNSSAMLFVAAKVSQLSSLPQGKAEADKRVLKMISTHDKEGFGSCTNTGACEAVCPKEISIGHIAKLNREFIRAAFKSDLNL
ncbi:MAG: succinate dehydrogenase/fumarate reductase iron-sulfur subunit [Zetaproteobacteria bacterium]|nr:succinate dehydrogenase/fumarate reductase iron-sulfur subunit [Pseudobdellovibrionaceae bacterium]